MKFVIEIDTDSESFGDEELTVEHVRDSIYLHIGKDRQISVDKAELALAVNAKV